MDEQGSDGNPYLCEHERLVPFIRRRSHLAPLVSVGDLGPLLPMFMRTKEISLMGIPFSPILVAAAAMSRSALRVRVGRLPAVATSVPPRLKADKRLTMT